MTTETQTNGEKLTFYFDPLCPWAWRTANWVREVRKEQPLDVEWKFFALAEANHQTESARLVPLRVAALVRRQGGNEAVDKYYEVVANAIHDGHAKVREDSDARQVARDALTQIGINPSLVDEAMDDDATREEVLADHAEARDSYEAFGVPWLVLDGQKIGFYGPVIDKVPTGQDAVDLWTHASWMLRQPYLYEFKRER